MIPLWIQAFSWGFVAGGALVLGALVGWLVTVPPRVVAGIMAFGAGVLMSALAFELMAEAHAEGGLLASGAGFLAGAAMYTLANGLLARRGAKHRKRSKGKQPTEQEHSGSGMALALGALLDGVPEAAVIGLGIAKGGSVGLVTLAAIFLSNIPEGLSSAAGMKRAGRSARYVFAVWGVIALASALAAWIGYSASTQISPLTRGATSAFAAGAILCMLADTMVPEAFEGAHEASGLITVFGFLIAFAFSHWN